MEVDSDAVSWIAYHSLLNRAPPFYWLGQLNASNARKLLTDAFNVAGWRKGHIVTYAGFYGATFYEGLRERLHRLGHTARPYRDKRSLLNVGTSKGVAKDTVRATELVHLLAAGPDQSLSNELERLDCSLYAPFD